MNVMLKKWYIKKYQNIKDKHLESIYIREIEQNVI